MSSKLGDELTKSKVLVFSIPTNFIIIWSWNIAGIQCITVKLFHIIMTWNGSDITIRLLHVIMKWNLSDFILLWRNSLPYWKTKFCQIVSYIIAMLSGDLANGWILKGGCWVGVFQGQIFQTTTGDCFSYFWTKTVKKKWGPELPEV